MSMVTEPPNNLRYSLEDADKYRRLIEDDLSPFKGATFKDVLVYAAAYGYKNGVKEELTKPQSNIPFTVLTDEDKWILRSIGVADEGTLEVLNNEREVYKVAEEYANNVIGEIFLTVFGGEPLEPFKRMSSEVLQLVGE